MVEGNPITAKVATKGYIYPYLGCAGISGMVFDIREILCDIGLP